MVGAIGSIPIPPTIFLHDLCGLLVRGRENFVGIRAGQVQWILRPDIRDHDCISRMFWVMGSLPPLAGSDAKSGHFAKTSFFPDDTDGQLRMGAGQIGNYSK